MFGMNRKIFSLGSVDGNSSEWELGDTTVPLPVADLRVWRVDIVSFLVVDRLWRVKGHR